MNAGNIHVKILADAEAMYREFQKVERMANQAAGQVKSAFAGLGATIAGAMSIKAIVQMADSVTTLNNQLKLATGGAVAAGQAYEELFAIAQRSRVSFTELGGTFASISRAGAELGLSQQRLLGVTEAISNAMTISGGSAASMNAALTQLGQGLASGTLRGEELNSVMEQTPRLAQALADGMGVSIGQLRELGTAGKITAEEVIKALESQSKTLASEVGGSAMTVGQALTQLQNAAVKTVGDMDEVTGASGTLAEALAGVATGIQTVGQFMRENEEAIKTTLGALGGAAVAGGIAATVSAMAGIASAIGTIKAAMVGLSAVVAAANPAVLLLLGIGAVAGAVYYQATKGPDLSTVENQIKETQRLTAELNRAEEMLAKAGGAGQGKLTAQLEERIAKLKENRDKLSAGLVEDKAITEQMRADEKQWTAEYRKSTAEAEASAKRLTDIKNELYKVDTKYIAKVQELAAQRNAGNISEAEYVKLVKMSVDASNSKEKSSTKLSEAAKAQAAIEKEAAAGLELYSNLIAETAGFQGDYAEKVSQLAEAYAANKISLEGLTFAHEKLLAKQPAAVEATKAEAEARKVLADAVIASARAYEEAQQAMDALQADTWQMVNDTVKASKDSAAAVQFELGLIGQTTEARRIAIEQRKIELDLEEKIKKVKATPFEGGEEAQLREINRLREAAAQDSATAISRIQLDEAAKSVEQYDKIFREGFAAMIAGGKDSWKSFTKSLTTTFKTAVVDQIYKAFAQPFVVNVVANMAGITGLGGPGGAAGAGNSLANGIQTASSLNTLYGTASQAIYGATAGATAASLGYANAVGMVGGDALGALIAANGGWAGVATGSAAAAEAAIAANLAMEAGTAVAMEAGTMAAAAATQTATAATAAASTAGSLMSTVATAMPYLAAISAAAMIISSFDDSGTPHSGGVAKYSAGSGLKTGLDGRGDFGTTFGGVDAGDAGMQLAINTAVGLTGLLDDMAKTFGKKAGYEVITAFADDASGDGAWGALRINSPDGTTALNWDDTRTSRWAPKEFSDGQKGIEEYNKAIAADVKKYLISQAPEWAKTVFEGLGDAPTLDQLGKAAQSVGTLHKVLGAMGENVLPALADASDSAITALVKAAGGADALTASLASYYEATATDLDRQQFAFTSLSKALEPLGTTLPTASTGLRDWYDGLVQTASAQDLTVQANADQLASLLALNPAIDGLAEAWDATLEGIFGSTTLGALANAALRGDEFATAVINAAGGLEAFGEAITGYYDNFYTESERAAMTTAQITKELAKVGVEMPKTSEEFRALMDASVAMGEAGQPVVNALLKVQGAFASVNRTADDVANERISLEERFFNAVATTAEMSEKARNAIDPMNRALYDAVLVAEATKAAVEAERKARVDGLKAEREAQAKLKEMSRQAVNTLSEGLAKLNAEATKTQRISAVTGLTAAEQAQNTALVDFIDTAYETQAELTKAGADTTETAAVITKALSQLSKSVENARLLVGDFAGAMEIAMEDAKRTSADLSRAFTSESEGSRRVILEESLKISREFSAYLSENALRVTDFAQVFGQAVGGAQGAAAQLAGMDYQEFADRFSDAVVTAVGPAVSAALSRGAAVGALPQNAQGVAAIRYVSQVQAQNTPSALAFQAQTELTAFKNLESAMQQGSITAAEFADAIAILRSTTKTAGDTIEDWSANLQKFVDVYAATGGAGMETAEDIGARAWQLFDTAAGSAEFYFRQMGDAVKEFNAEASGAAESIDAVTGFVGRMKSAAAVFGESAQAMSDGAAGNPYKNYQTGVGTEFDPTLYNSNAVSSAADTLAGVITTRAAAAITDSISALPSFDTGSIDAFKGRFAELTKAINETSSTDPTKLVAGANALVDFIKSADLGDARIEGLLEANTDKWAGGFAGINQLVYDLDAVVNSISSTGASAKDVALLMQDLGEFDNAGLEKTFYRLSDALNTGKISAKQYSELIELSSKIYLGTADVTKGAVETIEEAYNRLKNVTRTNEDIAREKISLEERLFAATATSAQIAEKARNAIDAHNQSLYDEVIAAEAAKALNQTKKEVEAEMFQADIRLAQAMGNKAEADRLQREAFIAGLGDLTEAQKAAKIAAYDYSKAIDNQIEAFDLLKGINAQIEELQPSSGPLDKIKTGIQAYITKLKELGQLTPDAQTAIDNLSELQLGQGRKNLYDQLLSPEEKTVRDAMDLSASFAGLGVQMPTTTAAFRALIDTTTDPTLKDSLLELVPTFVSVQGAAAQAAETIEEAYNRLKNAPRTNEDIAREKISLEERLFAATATTAQIAEKARNAIDAHNQSLYDEVIAAEAAKALNQTKKEVESEMFQADIRLAQALGNKTEADRLQREAFIAGLGDLTEAQKAAKIAAYDYSKAIDNQIEAMQTKKEVESEMFQADIRLAQALGNKAEADRLQREAFIAGLGDLTEAQKAAKIAAYDYSKAIDNQIEAMQTAKTAVDNAMSEVRRLIQEEIGRLEQTFAATDKAMAALDRAAEAQRTTLNKQLEDARKTEESVKGIFDTLRSSVRELRGEVESTAAMQADQARSLIRDAITTGVLPEQKQLDEAIGAARAGLESQVYATAQDADFAKLVFAGELEKLQNIAEPQLSAAEQAVILAEDQLTALDNQLKQAKAMVDGIRGVDTRILTVSQAMEELQTATAAETIAREQIGKLELQLTEAQKQYNELRGIKTGVDAIAPALQTLATAIASEAAAAQALAASTAAAAAARAAASAPVTTVTNYYSDYTTASYYQTETKDPVSGVVSGTGGGRVVSRSIDAYATGGYYPGGLALVGEQGPELINFAQPGQVYTAPQTRELLGGMGGSERMASLMGEMAQEIRSLRAEVVQLRRSADKGNEHTAVIAQAHEGRGQAPLLVEIAQ